jgi:hypothetical protein
MDKKYYLDKFQKSAARLDKKLLAKKQIEVATGVYMDSVFLKLYKKQWANSSQNPLTSDSRIFFSVWINDSAISEQKILYNIHALKLRLLKGYSIESRRFAASFRENFKGVEHQWQNVSVKFGPLTLMQGWLELKDENFENEILKIANQFLEIDCLIDENLTKYKKL